MKTSPVQFEMMVTVMEKYGDLNKPTPHYKDKDKLEILQRWEDLTCLLNSDATGDTKSTVKWRKVWSDFKNNTKKKAARLRRAASGTLGQTVVHAKLTDLEKRVLKLIGHQEATGLALEEAEFSQDIPLKPNVAVEEYDVKPVINGSQVEENVELRNQPSPVSSENETAEDVHRNQSSPVSSEIETAEDREDMHQPLRSWYRVPKTQSAQSGQTAAQGCVRGLPHRVYRRSQGIRRGSPQRSRRSPRHLIRLERSEEAAQHFLKSDREWRQFKMDQHRDNMDMKREQLRIREMELLTQREWQAVAIRGLDLLERFVNNYHRD